MLKIGSVRWKGRCAKHPRYDPAIDGLGGIRGGCKRCELLFDIHTEHAKLVRLIREFGTREETRRPAPDESNAQLSLLDFGD